MGKLQARQTVASSASSSVAQPTITLALSLTFTPAASCTSNKLTMLPPPGYYIWANEPVPYNGTTVTNCYPSEFLASYTSVSADTLGSSIVPVMSPLVCPSNFCTNHVGDNNYIACCPSGYELTPPLTPKIRDRPVYGGTCYSPFSLSQTVTVLKYQANGETNIEPWIATTTGANAYAHPIDGFAHSFPKIGCAAVTSSSLNQTDSLSLASSSSSSAVAVSPFSSNSNSVSPGTIAGAVVGSLAGLAAIIAIIFFLLRRRKQQRSTTTPEVHQLGDGVAKYHYEKDAGVGAAEIGTFDYVEKYGQTAGDPVAGQAAHELSSDAIQNSNTQPVHELPSWRDSQGPGLSLPDQKNGR